MTPATPDTPALPTKERLIWAAARLFHTQGYNGAGMTEILAEAKAPKGSLYHHFPNGKSDLALAAATMASDVMLRVIAASFAEAKDFNDGATTLCYKLAKLFDKSHHLAGCPVSAMLFQDAGNGEFQAHASRFYNGWIGEVEDHADRLGISVEDATHQAEHLFMLIQGAWQLARARRCSQVLRGIPRFLS